MDKVYYNYLNYLYSVYMRYVALREEYEAYPPGRLETYHSQRDGIRYLVYTNGRRSYLSPNKAELISLYKRKSELDKKLKAAQAVLADMINPSVKKIINMPHPLSTGFPISVSEENYRRDELKHKTAHGEMVRSKSEVIIADILFDMGVPYVYEKKLKTKEGVVYPDFTVKHPFTGNTYYIEHAGMLNDADYAADHFVKLSKYKTIGISESNYLIVTTEESGNINAYEVQEKLEKSFTFKRFLPLLEYLAERKKYNTCKKN